MTYDRDDPIERTTIALDILTDLTVSPIAAFRRFADVSRKWKPISRAFVLHIGERLRSIKMDRALEQDVLARWADDGGAT